MRGYSEERITVWIPMAILDNLYRKCYNKCNDDNKKAISHQTVKFALQAAFAIRDINSRRTPKNALQRIYINYGNTKSLKLYAVGGHTGKGIPIYKQRDLFVKSLSCGYKMVTVIRLRLTAHRRRW